MSQYDEATMAMETAARLRDVSFYVCELEGRWKICCRERSMVSMTRADCERLAEDLNEAIWPVIVKHSEEYADKVRRLIGSKVP